MLDLTRIPAIPGFFSEEPRRFRLYLKFLHHFAQDIMQPVARDDRVHTEYVPSQIVTEYLREQTFKDGKLDGIMYGSVASPGKRNVVLFLEDLEPERSIYMPSPFVPLRFIQAKTVKID
ncbi:RES domain protein [compost metagenome]